MRSAEQNKAEVENFIASNLRHPHLVIELGCGPGDRLEYISNTLNKVCMGIDIFPPYVEKAINRGFNVSCCDILDYLKSDIIQRIFRNIPICFVLIDVIEHLTKDDALEAIRLMKTFNSDILIFAPLGHIPQEEYDSNPHQKHLSSWTEQEFIDLGFNTRVINNFHSGLPEGWSTDVVFASYKKDIL